MASASYLEPVDLVRFYDTRRVLQLASDDGEEAVEADLTNSNSAAYKILLDAIRWGASQLDSHCQQGKRYTRTTLEAIVADADANPADETKQKRAALILQLVADLSFGMLASRRGFAADSLAQMVPRYESALATLERLAVGVQIFDSESAINRGVPSQVRIGGRGYRPQAFNRLFGVFEDTPRDQFGGGFGAGNFW